MSRAYAARLRCLISYCVAPEWSRWLLMIIVGNSWQNMSCYGESMTNKLHDPADLVWSDEYQSAVIGIATLDVLLYLPKWATLEWRRGSSWATACFTIVRLRYCCDWDEHLDSSVYDSFCDGSFFFIMQFHDKTVVSKLHSMAFKRHDFKHIPANNHAPVSSQGNQIAFNCYQGLLYEASNFILDLRQKT